MMGEQWRMSLKSLADSSTAERGPKSSCRRTVGRGWAVAVEVFEHLGSCGSHCGSNWNQTSKTRIYSWLFVAS